MVSWTPSRRARLERIDAEAETLIRELGDGAYHEARRREHEASSDTIAEDWALVARAVARQTGSRVGLNISTQLEMNTYFVLDREPGEARRASVLRGGGARTSARPKRRPESAAVPDPIYRRGDGFWTIAVAGNRDPRVRRFRRDHRRRDLGLAAEDGRAAHPRPRWPRGFRARESWPPSAEPRLTRILDSRSVALRPIGNDRGGLRRVGGLAFANLVNLERLADPAQRQR